MSNSLNRLLALVAAPWAATAQTGVAGHVDPFAGIDKGGDTIPGPALPFGMIKPGPDVVANQQNSGWAPSGAINGFSQTHVSGTGGGASYGNILIQPTTGEPQASHYQSDRNRERGSIGYYAVQLLRYGIDVELTTAARAALYRFTYPKAEKANILFDAMGALALFTA